jgi:hypothetical protein
MTFPHALTHTHTHTHARARTNTRFILEESWKKINVHESGGGGWYLRYPPAEIRFNDKVSVYICAYVCAIVCACICVRVHELCRGYHMNYSGYRVFIIVTQSLQEVHL